MNSKINKRRILAVVVSVSAILSAETAPTDVDARQKVIEFMTSAGLSEQLYPPVKISREPTGVISIADEGNFLMQYLVVEPNVSADAKVAVDPNLKIPSSVDKTVIVTHGWIDKAGSDWPADLAGEIRKKVDPNKWICVFFDWRGGAAVVNPVDAAKYARDIAGPRLAKAVLKLGRFEHVHLIAHSAGCWAIDSASKIIVEEMRPEIHLTFLDAYVPPRWTESDLGSIDTPKSGWTDHYYTKDITLRVTHTDLTEAHNVDITDIDPVIKEHEFPYRWYYATVAGGYRDKNSEAGDKVITGYEGIDYGFARSAEAGRENWQKSLTLKTGNKAVKLKKPQKKLFDLKLFK